MTIVCWSVKRGSGTTVTAVSLARVLSERNERGALLVDTQGDALMVLGREAADAAGVPNPGLRNWLSSPEDVHTTALENLTVDAGRNLRVLPAGDFPDRAPTAQRWSELSAYLAIRHESVVVDLGTLSPASRSGRQILLESASTSLLVVRPCYLAIRRAIDFPVRPTGVVLLREPERTLTADDISAALGVDVVATVHVDPRIARSIDTGLLGTRMPRPLVRAYRHVAA
jgi:hypothetical protein